MKHFRRSGKHDKSDSKANNNHASIPQKDPIAIVPPKKVIKALYDYNQDPGHQNAVYLNFSRGDFLHVVGREDDNDWYEACNPMVGSRGLVPVQYFEVVGKQARGSTGFESGHTRSASAHHPDSGYAEKSDTAANGDGRPRTSRQLGKSGAMVYGIVQYDFHAERPDELEAKAGEAIIVIAQSNPEWFVAKPITRLGGPGLIPVAFIQIHDMTTGQAVADSAEAIRRAGVPKVEEWKKMAAEYKNSSIPLGKFDTGPQSNMLNHDAHRMSTNSRGSGSLPMHGSDPRGGSNQTKSPSASHHHQISYSNSKQMHLVAPVRAKVPSYSTVNEEFMFVVEVLMEDGRCWELQRHYKDFYGLQLAIIEEFPHEAGRTAGRQRRIPYMPGPLPWVTERLTVERRQHLDKYIRDLLGISREITTSNPVCSFFCPKDGDREISAGQDVDFNLRHSQSSHQSSFVVVDSTNSSQVNLPNGGQGFASPQKQQRAPSGGPHLRSPSDLHQVNGAAPPMNRNNSALTSVSATSLGTGYGSVTSNGSNPSHPPPPPSTVASSGTMKIKAWFGEESCVMIRLAPSFTYDDLIQKISDRWILEMGVKREELSEHGIDFDVQYRDEQTGQYRSISNDSEVNEAKDRCEKLTLWVSSSRAV